MAFEKGNKQGGRTKGAVNKVTQNARELFLETLEGQSEHLSEAFEKVRQESPSKYLDLFAKYAQYFVPKKTDNKTELTGEIVQNIIELGQGKKPNETTK